MFDRLTKPGRHSKDDELSRRIGISILLKDPTVLDDHLLDILLPESSRRIDGHVLGRRARSKMKSALASLSRRDEISTRLVFEAGEGERERMMLTNR